MYPGASKLIFDEAASNAAHAREMEKSALRLRWWDAVLHRLLPFGVVMSFLIASTLVAIFANIYVGGLAMGATLGSVLIAYLTGKAPRSSE